jgi:malonyl CoA-acyl carrier protein transacylase
VIQKLSSLGVGRYLEIGAGGVLTGLLRNINSQLEGSKFGAAEDLEKVHAAIA